MLPTRNDVAVSFPLSSYEDVYPVTGKLNSFTPSPKPTCIDSSSQELIRTTVDLTDGHESSECSQHGARCMDQSRWCHRSSKWKEELTPKTRDVSPVGSISSGSVINKQLYIPLSREKIYHGRKFGVAVSKPRQERVANAMRQVLEARKKLQASGVEAEFNLLAVPPLKRSPVPSPEHRNNLTPGETEHKQETSPQTGCKESESCGQPILNLNRNSYSIEHGEVWNHTPLTDIAPLESSFCDKLDQRNADWNNEDLGNKDGLADTTYIDATCTQKTANTFQLRRRSTNHKKSIKMQRPNQKSQETVVGKVRESNTSRKRQVKAQHVVRSEQNESPKGPAMPSLTIIVKEEPNTTFNKSNSKVSSVKASDRAFTKNKPIVDKVDALSGKRTFLRRGNYNLHSGKTAANGKDYSSNAISKRRVPSKPRRANSVEQNSKKETELKEAHRKQYKEDSLGRNNRAKNYHSNIDILPEPEQEKLKKARKKLQELLGPVFVPACPVRSTCELTDGCSRRDRSLVSSDKTEYNAGGLFPPESAVSAYNQPNSGIGWTDSDDCSDFEELNAQRVINHVRDIFERAPEKTKKHDTNRFISTLKSSKHMKAASKAGIRETDPKSRRQKRSISTGIDCKFDKLHNQGCKSVFDPYNNPQKAEHVRASISCNGKSGDKPLAPSKRTVEATHSLAGKSGRKIPINLKTVKNDNGHKINFDLTDKQKPKFNRTTKQQKKLQETKPPKETIICIPSASHKRTMGKKAGRSNFLFAQDKITACLRAEKGNLKRNSARAKTYAQLGLAPLVRSPSSENTFLFAEDPDLQLEDISEERSVGKRVIKEASTRHAPQKGRVNNLGFIDRRK